MPPGARLKVTAPVALAAVAVALLVPAAARHLSGPALMALLLPVAVLAVLAADAFWPRVNLFGPAVVRVPGSAVALTFDDGPVEPWTAQVLEVLERYGVKGTFFCIGENVERHPELARALVERGHTVGGHTASHRSLLLAGPAEVRREIEGGQEALRRATGKAPVFFRCPRGYKNPLVARVVRRLGLRLVGYSYPVWDVQNPPAAEIAERVLGRVRAGDIIVMHDGFAPSRPGRRDGLVEALPAVIEGLREKGLKPVSLDEALEG